MPLDLVDRLEEFPATPSSARRIGGRAVPRPDPAAGPPVRRARHHARGGFRASAARRGRDRAGRTIGIVVDRILDIVEDKLEVRRGVARHGLLGSAVIQQKVTDLLDVRGIVRTVACDASLEDAMEDNGLAPAEAA